MRKTSPLMKILPIAVLAAVLFYFAVQLYNYLSDPVSTTLVTDCLLYTSDAADD